MIRDKVDTLVLFIDIFTTEPDALKWFVMSLDNEKLVSYIMHFN